MNHTVTLRYGTSELIPLTTLWLQTNLVSAELIHGRVFIPANESHDNKEAVRLGE